MGRLAGRRTFGFSGDWFVVDRGVFHPERHLSGVALAAQLGDITTHVVPEARTAVEIGTGCGLLGATLARHGLQVVATDIDHRAVRCASENCAGLSVDVRRGDMFSAVTGEQFDLAVVNPPYERDAPRWRRSSAFTSPDFLERFGACVHDFAPVAVIGFPVDDQELLVATGLALTRWRVVPTQGRDLGVYIAHAQLKEDVTGE